MFLTGLLLCILVALFVLPAESLTTGEELEETPRYRLPPREVVEMLDAKPTPVTAVSPDRSRMLLVDYEAYPSIELLARPFLKLGGIRVDPQLQATQRTTQYTGITLLTVVDGVQTPLKGLPLGAKIGFPSWSPDGTRFVFTRELDGGLEVWVGEVETATCRPLRGFFVTDVLAGPYAWLDDSRALLAVLVPSERQSLVISRVPQGPVIQETEGKFTRTATYQDLLTDAQDEAQFVHYGTTQLARINSDTGEVTPVGKPDLLVGVRPSPDEKYLLVTRLRKPFSYRVPYFYFSRTVEVWNAQTGASVYTVAELPVSDEVPQQGVPTGPRSVLWQEKKAATLLWVEALDDGDPLKKVPHRDRVLRLAAPFDREPDEIMRVVHRFSGWDWPDRVDEAIYTEYDRDRRWRTTYLLDLQTPDEQTVLFDLSINDAYNEPGSFIYQSRTNGDYTLLQDGDAVYLAGRGASEEGDRPFLDRFDLNTKERVRLFHSAPDAYESFLSFAAPLTDDRQNLLIGHQTPTQPGNFFALDLTTGDRRALTHFTDPHPQITGLKKERVKYARVDGVPLSGTLYLPPDYDPASGKRLPLLLWAYPLEYSDAQTAGQVRGSTNTFTRLGGTSPLWFVTQGYAVLNDATMPVVGDPEHMNDTFIEQIVGAAKAAIDELAGRGLIDKERVVVGGHSYGAFMTANLLAHAPQLFAAGIARSGAYNRTLTPFGFQSERRSFWEAKEVYQKISPFNFANIVKIPLMLIHGAADNNPGTFTIQSERFYQALQANGATARLVLLPHESHGYRARESVLHTLAEMFAWADRYAKDRSAAEQ